MSTTDDATGSTGSNTMPTGMSGSAGPTGDTEATVGPTMSSGPTSGSSSPSTGDSDDTSGTGESTGTREEVPPGACGAAGPLAVNMAEPEHSDDFEVSTDGFELVFESAHRHALTQYRVAGDNLLYTREEDGERYSGVGLFGAPAPGDSSVYAYSDLNGGALEVEVFSVGPAVVQFYVLWGDHTDPFDNQMQGSTIFTITPDGRVVRDEQGDLKFPVTTEGYWATEYAAVDQTHVDEFDWGGDILGGPQAADFEDSPFDMTAVCGTAAGCEVWLRASGSEHEMTLASHHLGDDGSSWTGQVAARITEHSDNDPGPNRAVTLQFDWRRGGGGDVHPDAADYQGFRGAFMMYGGDAQDDCGPTLAEAFLAPPAVNESVLGKAAELAKSTFVGITGDLDDDGYYETGGFYGFKSLTSDSFDVSWDADLPSVLVFMDSAKEVSEVRIDGVLVPPGVWFTQVDGVREDSVAWLYLGAEIPADAVVTVTLEE